MRARWKILLFFMGALPSFLAVVLVENAVIDRAVSEFKDESNDENTVRKLKSVAFFKNRRAAFILSEAYARGWVTKHPEHEPAIYWYRRTQYFWADEEASVGELEFSMATIFFDGEPDVPRDPLEAKKWLRASAKRGNQQAKDLLKIMPDDD